MDELERAVSPEPLELDCSSDENYRTKFKIDSWNNLFTFRSHGKHHHPRDEPPQ